MPLYRNSYILFTEVVNPVQEGSIGVSEDGLHKKRAVQVPREESSKAAYNSPVV